LGLEIREGLKHCSIASHNNFHFCDTGDVFRYCLGAIEKEG